ncbi:uncharacterized protein LOC126888891 [Diabrotica virgifera virgifera]|uniref:Uncharacterized protein n=1 Tax=Diabrotica virgifera virgifera TaxID=50390 RepID=A0ABM5KSX2_DIAVI|nr:uncharacterized protein LOC126888891 [Diabrotica virgifera virgifera]
MTNNIQEKIRAISRSNPVFFARTRDDLIASDNAACISTELHNLNKKSVGNTDINKTENEAFGNFWKKWRKGFEKGKGYNTKSIGKRYREISGIDDMSEKQIIKKMKNYFGDAVESVRSPRQNEPTIFLRKFSKEQAIETIVHNHDESDTLSFSFGASEQHILVKICQTIRSEINKMSTEPDLKKKNVCVLCTHVRSYTSII